MNYYNKLKSLDKDDLLDMLGLETRRSNADFMVPALALFGVGVLVGTGIGLLVAPRPGRELRDDLAQRLQSAPDTLSRVGERANDAVRSVGDTISQRVSDMKNA